VLERISEDDKLSASYTLYSFTPPPPPLVLHYNPLCSKNIQYLLLLTAKYAPSSPIDNI